MIKKNKVSGLKYLIIAAAMFAFMVLLSSPEAFAQLSTFSGSGGYGYPGRFYGGYPGYGYPFGYGYQPPPYGYYQPPTLANDVWGYPFGFQEFFNPYVYQQSYYPYRWNPYGYQQPYNSYGYGYSPEDIAIMAAGGLPSWFEMPDWEERWEERGGPYPYGLPLVDYEEPPPFPPPWYFQTSTGLANDVGGYPVRLPY